MNENFVYDWKVEIENPQNNCRVCQFLKSIRLYISQTRFKLTKQIKNITFKNVSCVSKISQKLLNIPISVF